ncbi:dUTP diphosphatase [Shouchella lehensis]|uniref:2-Deoxyuridine 5-triphosphate nucleotidohydrolase n=1 Tax=Shouchella lehensis G1 TaxID=1246626 RepID=A0A060M4B8_9BACI|nr:dUTP diphosphatase [Shouchella lehensis]AIC95393.1 2-Deoxyuridine 5-triphosphate nucleotidohydrolase [Shouchella lehensis G1]
MNLQRLFKIQAELDTAIIEKKGLHGKDLLADRILALLVELGECANEWRGFKFWSEDQEPRTFASRMKYSDPVNRHGAYPVSYSPLLEEYVDCLHFVLSIGNSLMEKYKFQIEYEMPFKVLHSIPGQQFLTVFARVNDIDSMDFAGGYESHKYRNSYEALLKDFFGLGTTLRFSWEEVETAYLQKNKINHERQVTGY